MRGDRRLEPGERRHGFTMPVPHTRSARKALQMYLRTLRPVAHEIAAYLPVSVYLSDRKASPVDIGAAYLAAFLDDLAARLEQA